MKPKVEMGEKTYIARKEQIKEKWREREREKDKC